MVVSDYSGGYAGTGNYNLYVTRGALSPARLGSLADGVAANGQIDVGALDSYFLDVTVGKAFTLTLTNSGTGGLHGRIDLYSPTGASVTSASGTSPVTLSYTATGNGTYRIVISDYSGGYAGTGSYSLTATGAGSPLAPNGDVPVPPWAMILLGAGLIAAMRRRQRAQESASPRLIYRPDQVSL